MAFKDLRSKTLTEKLEKKISDGKFKRERDPRFFILEKDNKTNTGSALLRFLPNDVDDAPYVCYYRFSFKGPTDNWYSERSLGSLGPKVKDPVAKMNALLWKTDDEAIRAWVRQNTLRKTIYIGNVYCYSHSNKEDDNGKVFLYSWGPQIQKIIEEAIAPQDEFTTPINPFNFWAFDVGSPKKKQLEWVAENGYAGADFILKMSFKANPKNPDKPFPTFEKSQFATPPSMFGNGELTEQQMEEIWNTRHDLKEFDGDDKYKTYEELEEKLISVMGGDDYVDIVNGLVNGTGVSKRSSTKSTNKKTKQKEIAPEPEVDEDDSPFIGGDTKTNTVDELDNDEDEDEIDAMLNKVLNNK